jgi:hypothetical protein
MDDAKPRSPCEHEQLGQARYSGGHNRGPKPAVTTPHRAVPSTYGRQRRPPCRRKVRWGRRAETCVTDLTNKPSERTQVCTCEQRASHRRESRIEARTCRDERDDPADTTASQDRCANTFRRTPQVEARRDDASSHRPGYARPGDRDLPVDAKSDETAIRKNRDQPVQRDAPP